ncbi:MAG: oligosaccharide flippase family protein [Planctomycetota bacterium]|jgi:O-antigen/teichoic acid export membrane protein
MSEGTAAGDGASLRGRVARGAAWILGAVAARQALRLVSSVIITRLLLPDDFGLATTAMLLGVFVEMCADFGIRQAIVQHRDGGTRRFLDVAWTLALWRSFGVSAVIVVLAGPFATAMADERLQTLAMLTALLPPLQAACSPGRLAWMRELRQDRINQLDLAVDVARLPLNIAGALLTGNAYGIVFAGIAAEAVRVGLSYVMAPERPRFAYERAVAVDLLRYGRYVFVASVLGFFAVRLDAFFVARFLGMNAAGTYGLAQNMTAPIEGIASQLLGGLLFPYLAKFQHDLPAIRTRMRQVLKALLLGGTPLAGLAVLAAPYVVDLLYDDRYQGAAGPLQWMIVAIYFSCLGTALNCPLMATGRPHWGTLATAVRLVAFGVSAWFLGEHGAVGYAAAIAASTFAFLVTLACVPWTPAR